MFEINVGGVTFESDPKRYDRAFVVEPSGFIGWYESVDVRGKTASRPAQHGDYDLPVFRQARLITISGAALASSEFDLVNMGRALTAVAAGGDPVTLTVQDSIGSLRSVVRLSGGTKFSPHPSGLEADFQVSFKAADPRLYGERRSFSGGTVDVHHMGNFPASPVVTIAGPRAAPYTITGPGNRVVQVNQALTSGQTHRIDFRTGRVFRNNTLQVGVLGQAGFWAIPPGKTSSMELSQGGSMTVTLDDTYM